MATAAYITCIGCGSASAGLSGDLDVDGLCEACASDPVLTALRTADQLRATATILDRLAADAPRFEASTLRRSVKRIKLEALAILSSAVVAAGCAATDEAPMPIADSCVVLWSNDTDQGYACNGEPDPEGMAFSRTCTLEGASGDDERPYVYACVARSVSE